MRCSLKLIMKNMTRICGLPSDDLIYVITTMKTDHDNRFKTTYYLTNTNIQNLNQLCWLLWSSIYYENYHKNQSPLWVLLKTSSRAQTQSSRVTHCTLGFGQHYKVSASDIYASQHLSHNCKPSMKLFSKYRIMGNRVSWNFEIRSQMALKRFVFCKQPLYRDIQNSYF